MIERLLVENEQMFQVMEYNQHEEHLSIKNDRVYDDDEYLKKNIKKKQFSKLKYYLTMFIET
jgi:Zn-finger nucleic acid-binding protein